MTRIMRDSTTAADIPLAGLQLVAGYVNGRYQWTAADWARFGSLPRVTIDVLGTEPAADVLDVEPGDANIATAVTWTRAKRAAQPAAYPPVLYSDRSQLTPLFNALKADGLEVGRDFRLWIATLDGTETVPDMTGVTAVQYLGESQTGGHYDQSKVYDDRWKVPTVPPPPPVVTWQAQALKAAREVVTLLEAHQ